MTHIRAILAIIAGGTCGVLAAELILGLGPRDAGVCIAIAAACVILRYLVKAIQQDRARKQERMRRGRDAVWRRRADDPDWLFKAPFWQLPANPFEERR